MGALNHRIDFLGLISVFYANPNGDPLKNGRPRTDSRGFGIISPECIKRKLRDRLAENGEDILVSPQKFKGDLLSARASEIMQFSADFDYARAACEKWFDVRAFGQVFPFGNVPINGIKGAASIQPVFSAEPIKTVERKITCCIPFTSKGKEAVKGFANVIAVEYGLYRLQGSVNAYQAETNGFTQEDAEKLKYALLHIFDNDSSSKRPAGSMRMNRLFWWEHSSKSGDYSPARVFDSVNVTRISSHFAHSFNDYEITVISLEKLSPQIYEE